MPLDPKRVQAVFEAAIGYDADAERVAVLDRECSTDAELRRRVEALLGAHDQADSFLDRPIVMAADHVNTPQASLEAGDFGPTEAGSLNGNSRDSAPTMDLRLGPGSADVSVSPIEITSRAVPTVPGYEIQGQLGRGGMGVVYKACQVRLDRPCALKMILGGAHAKPEAAIRFLAEARAIAQLRHPNIVQIHHIGEADGLPFFELEYIDGGSLDDKLDGTPWASRRAAVLVEVLASAIAEAHRHGIVHRDVKPGNIMLMADGTPKVTDFGLAKSLGSDSGLTATDSIMGSPSYMAPEQAAGQTKLVGPPADIYALGVILYELLTGRPPFRGSTILETLEQVKTVEPVPPSRLIPGLHRDIETVALKCLRKEPGKRYDSAAALAEDLRRFRAGEPIVARPVPFWERAIRWARRRPAIASLAVAVLLLLATLAGLGVLSYERINSALSIAEVRRKAAEASRIEAIKQSKAADANFARARRAVDDSFTIVSESKLLNVPGLRALRADLLGSSTKFYEEFVRERSDDLSLRNDLLRARLRVAHVSRELGRAKEANEAYGVAIAGLERALRDRPGDLDLKTDLADALHWTASLGSNDQKIATQRRIVALREEVFKARPADGPSKRDVALACSRLYESLRGPRPAEALVVLERSVVLRLALAEEVPDDADAIDGVFMSFFKLARAMGSSHSLPLSRRALEFGRESMRLRPNDVLTGNDFMLATQDRVAALSDAGRKDEALAELRRSVKALGEMARANADTPRIQETYVWISRDLADRLAALNRRDEAIRALLESRTALDRFPRETAADIAGSAGRNVALAQRLGEIKPDLTPEQKARRDELLDRAVSDYRTAVAGGWKDFAVLEQATPIKDRPDYSALFTEADSAAKNPVTPTASDRATIASAVSRPKLDVKLDLALTQAALGVARARSGLVDESVATMDKARARFDELARERPGDSEVWKARADALADFHVALSALAFDQRRRGKAEESAVAQRRADEFIAELSRRPPNDPDVEAARRRALLGVADARREASRWGETYLTLRKSEASALESARSVSAGGPADQSAVATLARVGYGYGMLALWDEARAAFSRAYEIDPVGLRSVEGAWDKGFGAWYRVAVLQLQGGETGAYERLRERMLRENAAGNLESPLDQIRIATLRPDPRSDWRRILELAEKFPEHNPWGQTVRGFALLRAGRNQEALDTFKKDPEWINAWPARAIAHHRLGQTALAHEWLDRADQHVRDDLDDALAGVGFTQSGWVSWWDDWLLRMIWTREAHELIDGKAWPDAVWMKRQRARVLARIEEAK